MPEPANSHDVLVEERVDHVAVLTLNRPSSLNAIDPTLARALRDAWSRLERDDSVWVVVITGAGDRAFCAGADLKAAAATDTFAATFLGGGPAPSEVAVPHGYLKPVICALNGLAYGGGLEIALSTDIQIAVPAAKLSLPEARIGSIPGAGGTQRLPRAIPRGIARRMALTGEAIDSDTALRLGLISEIVEPSDLRARALALAAQVCGNAPLAVRAIKKALDAADVMPMHEGLAHEQLLWGSLRDSEDRGEGRRAFAEKRPPVYRAR